MDNQVEIVQRVWYVSYKGKDYMVNEYYEPDFYYDVYRDGEKLTDDDPLVEKIWNIVKKHEEKH